MNIINDIVSFEINENDGTAKVINSPNTKGSIIIPRSIAFNGREYLITSINKNSFENNSEIQSISFPYDSEIQSIDDEAFSGSSLQSLFIPSSLCELKKNWCKGTSQLTKILVSPQNKHFTYIDDKYLISHNNVFLFVRRDIDEINIPSIIKKIGPFSFSECKSLKTVNFSSQSQIETISESAFQNSSLETIVIPSNITHIEKMAFYHCLNLNSINFQLNSKLNTINENAFSGTSIKSISIPSSVTKIGMFAFYGCSNLRSIEFSKGLNLLSIEKSAFSDSPLENITIPSSVTIIGECVFYSCGLKKIEFENNSKLNILCSSSFAWNSFKTVQIPPSVTNVEECAFESCMDLTAVEFLGENLKICDGCFDQSENFFMVSIPNAKEVFVSKDSFPGVSDDFSLFVRSHSKLSLSMISI